MNVIQNAKISMKQDQTKVPMRSTTGSAGYDIFAAEAIHVPANGQVTLELPFYFTGDLPSNLIVRVFVRSSFGIKKKVRIVVDGNKAALGKTLTLTDDLHTLTLLNDSDTDLDIAAGEHFAQFIVTENQPTEDKNVIEWLTEEELGDLVPVKGHVEVLRPNVYVFVLDEKVTLAPKEQVTLPSGLRTVIEDNTWTAVVPHEDVTDSIMLANQVGVIDRDYAFNESTKGNCFLALVNLKDEAVTLEAGTCLTTWFTEKYYVFDDEIKTDKIRTGGIGHT